MGQRVFHAVYPQILQTKRKKKASGQSSPVDWVCVSLGFALVSATPSHSKKNFSLRNTDVCAQYADR